ncbi:M20 metallopeptidase family protein [Amycolatopsis magusensis]|uniref:M20 metallopeptidase family protein n=1 Tax=Amycolatopsis magusensis TaxID=882444 RepID=UPI0024A9735F|nr:M20 family metallopeptidase [Amycolatopsis magusensis]MDI5981325.1 M20 family metallopeptidase [Amycolatopsis magusensis]
MHAGAELHVRLTRLRRELHETPEPGLWLPRTQERVLTALDGLDAEVTTGAALSSITAVLRGSRPGPVVLLRADMDALPFGDGAVHSCGHDLHTAMLVGAAHLLREAEFPGSVVLMFQPGEEGHGGAKLMVGEGVLDAAGERPVAAYALHVVSSMVPHGVFVSRPGVVMGAADTVRLTLSGAGGHSAMPHAARSPIPAACAVVGQLPALLDAEVDAFEPAVATVTGVRACGAANVIPPEAEITVSLRTYTAATRARLLARITALAEGFATAHGLRAEAVTGNGYPVTTNDPGETEFAATLVRRLFGSDRYLPSARPLPASEDFAFVLDEVPGTFMALGACPRGTDPRTAAPNHSPAATFDDAVLADGARYYAELAVRRLHAAASPAAG